MKVNISHHAQLFCSLYNTQGIITGPCFFRAFHFFTRLTRDENLPAFVLHHTGVLGSAQYLWFCALYSSQHTGVKQTQQLRLNIPEHELSPCFCFITGLGYTPAGHDSLKENEDSHSTSAVSFVWNSGLTPSHVGIHKALLSRCHALGTATHFLWSFLSQ